MEDSDHGGRRLPWVRILAEGAAIVVGILLAFAIDAWWENRNERIREREVISQLAEEFRSASEELDFYLTYDRRILQSVEGVATILDAAERSGESSAQVPDTALAFLLIQGTYAPTIPSLDGLRATGRLSRLRDSNLTGVLSGWPTALEDAVEHQIDSQDFIVDHVYPALVETAPRLKVVTDQILIRFGFSGANADPGAMTTVQVTPELAAAVNYRAVLLSASVVEFQALQEHLAQILEQLASHEQKIGPSPTSDDPEREEGPLNPRPS